MKVLTRKTIGNRKATIYRETKNGKPCYSLLFDKGGKIQIPSLFGNPLNRKGKEGELNERR